MRRTWTAAVALLAAGFGAARAEAPEPPALSAFDRTILDAHNAERATVGVPPLHWSARLAGDAAGWARHLAAMGTLAHSPDDPRDPDPEGENLWSGTRGAYRAADMVGLWLAEKRNYRPRPIPASSRTGDFEDVGHYTQMVWRTTRTVGCAAAHGVEDDVLVCRYAEGGNVIGERAF